MRTTKQNKARRKLAVDALIIVLSIILTLILEQTGAVDSMIEAASHLPILSIFIGGLMFTSIFTAPISFVVLAELSLIHGPLMVALVAAFGSLVGDLVLFLFIRDTVARDVASFVTIKNSRLKALFKHRIFRWMTPLLGGLIIASPLPDELGLALMGFSRVDLRALIPISLIMNFIGILLIGLAAQAIV